MARSKSFCRIHGKVYWLHHRQTAIHRFSAASILHSRYSSEHSGCTVKAKIIGCGYCPRGGPKDAILRHEEIRHNPDIETEYTHTKNSSTLTELFPNLYEYFKRNGKNYPIKMKPFKC